MNSEMKDGMEMMLEHMRADYCGWSRSGNRDISEEIISASEKRYCDGLHYTVGQKYIKVINGDNHGSVSGFIVNTESDKKFRLGDILKPAGWRGPAKNFARGNILERNFDRLRWTGPF